MALMKPVAKKKEDETEEESQARQHELKFRKKQWRFAFGSLATVFGGFIIFILTQDMTLQVALSDLWTLAHLALLACSVYALSKVKLRKDNKGTRSENELNDLEPAGQAA